MHNERIFKLAIVCWLVTLIFAVGLSFSLESTLPAPLIQYLEAEASLELTYLEAVTALVIVVTLIVMLISLAKLYKLNVKARFTFAITNFILMATSLFFGPIVTDQYSAFIDSLGVVSTGFILAMAYTTDVLGEMQSREGSSD